MKNLLFLLLVSVGAACNNDDSARSTPPPDPIQFTIAANSGGCSNFQFYHYSDNRTYGLQLLGDSLQLSLTPDWQTYTLDQASLSLKLFKFQAPLSSYFCDDVIEANEDPVQTWDAQEGTIQLRTAGPGDVPGVYAIDVVLENVLVNGQRLDRIARSGIEVGWRPG